MKLREYKISLHVDNNLGVQNLKKLEYFSTKKERKEVDINKDLYMALLGFKFLHEGKLEQLGGDLWGSHKRFNFKFAHQYNREQTKEYFLSINYENGGLNTISILVEGIDFTKSGKIIIAGLDVSPRFRDNFTREYEYNKIFNKLILKRLLKGATTFDVAKIKNSQQEETLVVSDSNYFLMPEEIAVGEDGLFKISDMQNHFDIISIPVKLQ